MPFLRDPLEKDGRSVNVSTTTVPQYAASVDLSSPYDPYAELDKVLARANQG